MATHTSIPAWRIPWTEEPGGLQSTGLYRVGHDRASNTFTLFARHYESFGLHSVSNGNNQIARLILFLNKLIN